jgi:hypothetical protein
MRTTTREQKDKANARKRHRYATDPEYRTMLQARSRIGTTKYRKTKKGIQAHRRSEQKRKQLRRENADYRAAELVKQRELALTPEYKKGRRRYKLQSKYNLTLEDYELLYSLQDGKCAICEDDGDLCVDHSHITNAVRGLLCHKCNTALGLFKDSRPVIISAADYLSRNQ